MGELWERTLDDIRGRMGRETYNTWFARMRCQSESDGKLTLVVPDKFFRDFFQDHYYTFLVERLAAVAAREVAVDLIVESGAPGAALGAEPETTTEPTRPNPFNKKYTFHTYVVGQTNQFAVSAAASVAEAPGKNYNPLFLYGGSGLGKTHLLHAIGNALLDRLPDQRIKYLSTEQFTNQFITAIREHRMDTFRSEFRDSADCLLLDDIQFIEGKEQTEEEFFHTFNALHSVGKQIVLTSDRPASQIRLTDRLKSRFDWGLTIDIQPPAYETRVAIVMKKAEIEKIDLPIDVAEFLAMNIKSNVRELEGSLTKISAMSLLLGVPITLSLAREALKNVLVGRGQKPTVEAIQKVVANYYNVKISDLKGERRHKQIAYARQIAMYLARQKTDASFPDIGREFGDRDHSTVMSAVRKIERLRETDPAVRQTIEVLERHIEG